MTTTTDSPNLQMDFVVISNPRLWMSTTYKNTYVGNAAPSAALDVMAPLAGWYDCGSIQAVKIPVTKTMREVKRGTPQTARKFFEVDRTAMLNFNTADLSTYVEALIMGQTISTTLTGTAFHVASPMALSRSVALLDGNPTFSQFDIVACASPGVASLETSFNIAVVESLSASLLTLEGAGFPIAMTSGDTVKKINRSQFLDRMGVQTIRSAMLFWDDVVDSSGNVKIQHVLYFPNIRNFTGGDFDFKTETEEYETGVTLAATAVFMTFDDGSTGYDFYKKWVLSY